MPWMILEEVADGLFSTEHCISFVTPDGAASEFVTRSQVSKSLKAVEVTVLDADESHALIFIQNIFKVSTALLFQDEACQVPYVSERRVRSNDTFDFAEHSCSLFQNLNTSPIISREVIREDEDVRFTALKLSEDAKRELSTDGATLEKKS